MKTQINIKDSTLGVLTKENIEIDKIVNELLDTYLSCGLNRQSFTDLLLWRKHIELKIVQLQNDLDNHRKNCNCESSAIVLDSNIVKRANGSKSLLDANDFRDLQQSEVKPIKNKQTIETTTGIDFINIGGEIPI